jgi:hypothetical protein
MSTAYAKPCRKILQQIHWLEANRQPIFRAGDKFKSALRKLGKRG